ncbi:MAG: trigger factor [Alphaproteobacteria bacterium]|nr:trigger factor [Alphaproteobacteria bacterium]
MSVSVEQVSSTQRKMTFTVPASEVSSELDRAYGNLARTVRLKGFRRGHVPRKVVEARFGRSVKDEVSSNLMNKSFSDATSGLEFFGRPVVSDKGEVERGQDFTFAITIEVKPELALDAYTGVTVEYPVRKISDEQVQVEIDRSLQSQASLAEVEGRAAEAGDFVLASLKASEGDEVVHEHPGTMINTAAEPYYSGVEAILIGAEAGAEVSGEVTFGEDAQVEEVAGKTLQVTAKIESIQAMTTPELSDELAEQLGYEGGAEGMRFAIRSKLEQSANEAGRNQARANLLRVLIDANEFDVPRALVDQQLEALLEEIRIQRAYRGEDPRKIQFSDAQMQDYRSRARFAAKASLILEYVSGTESIVVTDDEIEAKYQEIADARGQEVAAIRGYFQKEDAVEELRARLLEEKTLDWLLERAELKEIDPANDNLAEEAPADEAAEAGGEE